MSYFAPRVVSHFGIYAYAGNNPVNFNDPTGLMPDSFQGWVDLGKNGIGVIANGFTVIGGAALGAGGVALASAGPEGINQVLGYATATLGVSQMIKGTGGVSLNLINMGNAWNNQPNSVPNSLPRYIANNVAPGSGAALATADAFDIGTDLLSLKAPIAGYYNGAGNFIRQSQIEADNLAAAEKSIGNLPLSVAAPGTSVGSFANIAGTSLGSAVTAGSWLGGNPCPECASFSAQSSSSAAGGFLLYPNQPNNNQIQSAYRK